ncbi:hypothetical protein P153DRAFT_294859 [Dothidotthia symphoricarpi CBS 119687]|uniref:Uncharacterized protein n=1 Tax=Dothidotthia symphoricarpi CBS 119687 TaxID=1392245 RepID=A0A6A6AAH2_9PLEO|nr:uncharacterized protein P153DRAFT_294859 [Dothidotthia symphoricarpi CBS 119687]KAF2127847.1 hypothetical protein P153DRAFT_294859 [Dothidotthia symphoricarpi CBS 119687]
MVHLCDVSYSRDATVAAIRDYYRFLVAMYLDESEVIEPPEGGWPSINSNTWENLDKTDTVISLLRHLPYIRDNGAVAIDGAPDCNFANWQALALDPDGKKVKTYTELDPDEGSVPPHVVGLTEGGEISPFFLLDTKLGIVHWYECFSPIREDPRQVENSPEDWAPDEEAEWRDSGAVWAIEDFFEVLKSHFRKLNFVPIGTRTVKDVWIEGLEDGMLTAVQAIYHRHNWPDLGRYRKKECMEEVQAMMVAQYSHSAQVELDD